MSSNQGNFRVRIRRQQPDIARLQPLAEKVAHQRRARARIGEHAPRLLIEDCRHPAVSPESPGRAVRRPGCCSTGRTTGARPVRRRRDDRLPPGATLSGSASIRNRKSGLTRSRSSAARMPASKSPSARALVIEAEQRLNVLVGRRPAIRTSSQRRQNLRRARRLLVPAGGMAHEDAAAAGRILRHRAVVRPANQQRRDEQRDAGDVGLTVPNRNAIRSEPLGLDRSDLTMVATTWWRPAFSGTRTCNASSASLRGFFAPGRSESARRRGCGELSAAADRERADSRAVHTNLDLVRLRSDHGSGRHRSSPAEP